jgi:hypothetical protein
MKKPVVIRVVEQPVRGCGKRKPGGTYLVSESSGDGQVPLITRLNPPVPVTTKFHRSTVLVNGNAILARQPEDEWLVGSSKKHAEKVRGDAWSFEVFGMTLTQRLTTGECKGEPDADVALAGLIGKVKITCHFLDLIKNLTETGAAEMPRASEHYARLVQTYQAYYLTHKVAHLIELQAAIWRLGVTTPPSKRQQVIPVLARMLANMTLPKDSMAILLKSH